MGFHCVNCGGSMVFDVASQQMRCEHCDTTMAPQKFDVRERGIAQDARYTQMARFSCQNCGAELASTDDSLVGFCPYCGGQSMVGTQGEGAEVERIIPFQVDKKGCTESYASFARRILYLPREFKDTQYLQRFTGIYMPYFEYDAKVLRAQVRGEKTVEHNSRYDVVNTYSYDATIDGMYRRGAPFDGSRYLDDEISDRVLPFDTSREVPFNAAYLAGFYADASSVSPTLYYDDASAQVNANVVGAMTEEVEKRDAVKVKDLHTVESQVTAHHSTLFPMWFLTWRKDDRVAYAVVNGESGKVVSDLPLDLRAFAVGSVIISAVVFAVLELFVQPTPLVTSLISLGAAMLMVQGVRSGAKRAYDTQVHTWDKGWNSANGAISDAQKNAHRSLRASKKFSVVGFLGNVISIAFVVFVGFFMLRSFFGSTDSVIGIVTLILPVVSLCFAGRLLYQVLKWHKSVKLTHGIISAVVLLVTMILTSVIIIVSPVNDGWYYLGDAVCIVGLIVAAVSMIRVFNLGTTRPLPKLFDREEVSS